MCSNQQQPVPMSPNLTKGPTENDKGDPSDNDKGDPTENDGDLTENDKADPTEKDKADPTENDGDLTENDKDDPSETDKDDPMDTTDISINTLSESESADTVDMDKQEEVAKSTDACRRGEQSGPTATRTDSHTHQQQCAEMDRAQSVLRDQGVSDSTEQLGRRQQQSKSLGGLPDSEAEQRNPSSQNNSKTTAEDQGIRCEQITVTYSGDASESRGRPKADVPADQDDRLNDSRSNGNSSFGNVEDDLLLAEFEKELSEKIKVVCSMVDTGVGVATETPAVSPLRTKTTAGGPPLATHTTQDEDFLTRTSSDDDIQFLDVPQQWDVNEQASNGTKGDADGEEKSQRVREAVKKVPQQDPEPVESIEISDDDDLFSSDEIDVTLLPSTHPHHSGRKSSAAEGGAHDSGQKNKPKATVESGVDASPVGEDSFAPSFSPRQSSSSNECRRKRDHREDKCAEVEVEKPKESDPRLRSADRGSGDVPLERQQGQRERAPEGDFPSFSVSAVEPSHRLSSLCSPGVDRRFKTSTPQQSADGEPTRQTHGTERRRSAGERNLFESYNQGWSDVSVTPQAEPRASETTAAQGGDLTRVSDAGSPAARAPPGSGSASVSGTKQRTPCVSVVEQDSLYITPAVEQSKIRRTFQLVTPAPQQHGACTVSETPAPRSVAERPPETPPTSLGSRGDVDASCKERGRRSGRGDRGGGGSPQRRAHSSATNASQLDKRKESGEFFGGENDSDSDLEIVDASLEGPPSPQFSTKAKLGSGPSQLEAQSADPIPPPPPLERPSDASPSIASPSKRKPASRSESAVPAVRPSGSSVHRFSPGNDSSPANSDGNSPAGGSPSPSPSPSSPLGPFSQRSADSDGELVRAVEHVSRQVVMEVGGPCSAGFAPTGSGVAQQLCHAGEIPRKLSLWWWWWWWWWR